MALQKEELSSTCRVCGRSLRVKVSMKRGIGPVCWKKLKRIEATNQKLDDWSGLKGFPWRPDTILDEEPEELCNLTGEGCVGDPGFCEECPVMVPEMEEPEAPGSSVKAKTVEVVA